MEVTKEELNAKMREKSFQLWSEKNHAKFPTCLCFVLWQMGLVMICLKSYGGCAGPLMDVPCVQDRVFYFPQGHIELV